MQTAHLSALLHLKQFSGRSSFFTWLTQMKINQAVSRARRARRRKYLEEWYLNPFGAAFMSMPPDPEEQLLQTELNQQLRKALEQLPGSCSALFQMREFDEMNTAEVSRSLGISEQSVKCRLHRARKLLRLQLHKLGLPARRHDLACFAHSSIASKHMQPRLPMSPL